MNTQYSSDPDQHLAVTAEALYLANLLLLPGFSFAALLWLYFRHRTSLCPGTLPSAANSGSQPLGRAYLGHNKYRNSVCRWLAVCQYLDVHHHLFHTGA